MIPAEEWERCAPWIQAALDRSPGFFTIEDVLERCERGAAVFWPGRRSAVVTEFQIYPRAKALNFWLIGGDLGELLDEMAPVIEAWAKAQGCTDVTGAGRRGWERPLAARGFETAGIVMRKRL